MQQFLKPKKINQAHHFLPIYIRHGAVRDPQLQDEELMQIFRDIMRGFLNRKNRDFFQNFTGHVLMEMNFATPTGSFEIKPKN